MQLKVFYPPKRKFYARASFDAERDTVRSPRGTARPREEFVLLPDTGLTAADGSPIFLGDAFKRTVATAEGEVVEVFIVGPLPAKGELVTKFALRAFSDDRSVLKATADGSPSSERQPSPACEDGLTSANFHDFGLTRAGNVYENFADFVPVSRSYCYSPIGWNGQFYHINICPFWQHSDHGLVYCRLTQNGSLTNKDADHQKALVHFGSQSALDEADNDWLLWDQIKSCGVNDDQDPEDDEEDEG